MSIAPQFISSDLTSYKDDILAYSTSGKASPVTYITGTDGVLSTTSLTSASSTFVSGTHVGMYVALQGQGYALVTAVPSAHVLTLDTSFTAATAVRFCVGAHAAIERDSFNQLKTDAVYGWSRTIMDGTGLPKAVRVRGLKEMVCGCAAETDFMGDLAATSTTFDDAHKLLTMARIYRKEAVQGGPTWKEMAATYLVDYYGALQTAVDILAKTLQESGDVHSIRHNQELTFVRRRRI